MRSSIRRLSGHGFGDVFGGVCLHEIHAFGDGSCGNNEPEKAMRSNEKPAYSRFWTKYWHVYGKGVLSEMASGKKKLRWFFSACRKCFQFEETLCHI